MTPIDRRNLLAGGLLAGGGAGAALALAAAPGALAREASERKPRRRIDAGDFGVVGDGAADDTNALQAALNETFGSGGFLDIPPGVYRVTQPLRIETKAKPAGNSTHSSGIRAHGARIVSAITDGRPVLSIVSHATMRFFLLEGLEIQGNGREGQGLDIRCEERGTYLYNFCLRDVVVQGCGGDGCRLIGNVFEGQLLNCYFRDNKGSGATFSHGPENTVLSAVHVFGCVFGGNGVHGATLVKGAADVSFHGCYFLLNGKYGLSADAGCTLLSNCGFENNQQSAASFQQGDAGVRLMVFGTLIGCTAYSIHRQTHLLRGFITNNLVMIGCTGHGDGEAKGAKLARLQAKRGASVSVVGCWGGIEHGPEVEPVEIGNNGAGARFGSRWDSGSLAQLGEYRLWIDSSGKLRVKQGAPTSDQDGAPVGS